MIDDDAAGLGWHVSMDEPVAQQKFDLYTVLLHEMGHVLGFTQDYPSFADRVERGPDDLTFFVGSDFVAALDETGEHLATDALFHDLMSSELEPGIRKLPSALDVSILEACYEDALAQDLARNGLPADDLFIE